MTLTEMRPETWTRQAACAGINPELWFPARGDHHTANAAIAICLGCPVRAQCLKYALEQRIEHGIWGGLPVRARRHLRRAMPRQPRPLPPHGSLGRYRKNCRCGECRWANTHQGCGHA